MDYQDIDPRNYRLVYASSNSDECVIILSPGESLDTQMDELGGDFAVSEVFEIDGDCTSLPCDRPLRG